MYKYVFIIIIFILVFSDIYAQKINFEESELESILETIARRTNKSEILDRIETLMNNPIDLSGASVDEIARIPTITYPMARSIKALVNAGLDEYEIIDSLKMTKESAYLLKYCSYIDRAKKQKTQVRVFKLNSRSRAIEQLNRLKGFEKDKFKGSRTDYYQRFLMNYGNFNAGVLFSKDLGEMFQNSFYSGFINGNFNNFSFVAGDFYVQSGLGNILWTQNTMGKGADVISSAYQFDNSIYNYKSSSEFGFFRGLALSNRFNLSSLSALDISAWASYTPRSATVSDNDTITSIYKTGLFRTESEISKQYSIIEKSAGGNVRFTHKGLNVGAATYYLDYSSPVLTSSSSVITGKNALLATAYAIVPLNSFSLSAEVSADGNQNMAYKLIGELKGNDFNLVVHGRSFASGFRSPYGYMFGEQTNPSNEYGLYTGFLYKGFRNVNIASYVDFYGSYKPTYYVPEPIQGIDIFSQTTFNLKSNRTFLFRLQYENKTDAKKVNKEKSVFQRSKYYLRVEYWFFPVKKLRIRLRGDFNLINFQSVLPDEAGIAGYVEGLYKIFRNFSLTGRFAYFSTNSYESAIWQFEYSLPGYLYMPALFGQGFRTYLTLNWSPVQDLSFRLRYVLMKKEHVNHLGSGYNEIYGNADQRLYLQLDFKL